MGCAASRSIQKKHHLGDNFVLEKNKSLESDYKIIKQLGKGSIGVIYLAESKRPTFFDDHMSRSGRWTPRRSIESPSRQFGDSPWSRKNEPSRQYAIKEINAGDIDMRALDSLKTEIRILKTLDHPFIIKFFAAYSTITMDQEKLSVVMELCSGGTLVSSVPYPEATAKILVANIVEAVLYLHKHNIIHRDLKNENVMFADEQRDPNNIRLLDFGLAKVFARNKPLRDRAGTIYAMSPEALCGDYNEKSDMWSIGVMTYHLLSGKRPFWGETRDDIIRSVTSARYSMDGRVWDKISRPAKSFVRSLLQSDPLLRSDPIEALKSPWLKKRTEINIKSLAKNELGVLPLVRDANPQMKDMHKLALYAIAHKLQSEHMTKLRACFLAIDKDQEGFITLDKMKAALEGDFTEEEVEEWFKRADIDESRVINFTEFVASSLYAQSNLSTQDIIDAFRVFDRNDSGFITADNLREALKIEEGEYIDKLIKEADEDGDGQISFREFRNLLMKNKLTVATDAQSV